jgi:hypothetical protein
MLRNNNFISPIFYRAGQLDYSVALDMLKFIDQDKDSMVWSITLTNLDFLDGILSSTNSYSLFRVSFEARLFIE